MIKLWAKVYTPDQNRPKRTVDHWEAPTQEDFDQFRSGVLPLAEAGKLGGLLVQYPAGFHFTPANLEKVETTLRWFYDYPKVVELRHKSWSERNAEMRNLLEENRASGVLIDEPKFATSIKQEFKPIGDIFYFRAHGRNAKAWWIHKESWERYDYCYSREEIKKMADRVETAISAPGIKKGSRQCHYAFPGARTPVKGNAKRGDGGKFPSDHSWHQSSSRTKAINDRVWLITSRGC